MLTSKSLAMTNPLKNPHLEQFTRDEFIDFVEEPFGGATGPETEDVNQVLHFKRVVSLDPRGGDRIYWPEEVAEDTPDGVLGKVEKFRLENGLPGFREDESPEPDTAISGCRYCSVRFWGGEHE